MQKTVRLGELERTQGPISVKREKDMMMMMMMMMMKTKSPAISSHVRQPYFIGHDIMALSKFSAPTIAFLAFDWLKNSDYEPIFGVYVIWKIVRQV